MILSFGAIAADNHPMPPMGGPNGEAPNADIMANLTDEQKTCIEQYGCPKKEEPAKPERPDTMGEAPKQPEMTDEQREALECTRKAMESCGIEMLTPPERPNGPNGEQRPDRPMGPNGGPRPERPNK